MDKPKDEAALSQEEEQKEGQDEELEESELGGVTGGIGGAGVNENNMTYPGDDGSGHTID